MVEKESERADLYGGGRGREKERSPVEVTFKQTDKSLELGREGQGAASLRQEKNLGYLKSE